MPQCKEIVALLSDYLDRHLPPETCSTVDAHLASCAECGEELRAIRHTVSLCKQYRSESQPGPLPPDKHKELADAFQKVLAMRKGGENP